MTHDRVPSLANRRLLILILSEKQLLCNSEVAYFKQFQANGFYVKKEITQ